MAEIFSFNDYFIANLLPYVPVNKNDRPNGPYAY